MASLGSSKLQTKMSAWTPLNHPVANGKFDKWSEGQRKCVLQDFLSRCSAAQLRFVSSSLERQLPLQAVDFTCMLPRVLSLFIFSYLDPRSLCRCATVSWHWRGIVELDQLWMPKCVRLAWTLPFSPTPYETSVWKRLYVETVRMLRCMGPQVRGVSGGAFIVPEVTAIRSATPNPIEQALLEAGEGQQPGLGLPPWRHADRHPKDTQRFNYLSNLDPVDQAKQAVRKPLTAGSYKLRKAKSQVNGLASTVAPLPSQTRPDWATPTPSSCDPHVTMASRAASAQWNAGIRPGPVRPAVPRLSVEALRASQRTSRTPPSVPLFESQPWISLDHRTPNLHPLLE
uniref:F-box protein 16 n=1 Tax=Gadus morhua TaxID=8049 RepID=A0A8C4Z5J6_GADMO